MKENRTEGSYRFDGRRRRMPLLCGLAMMLLGATCPAQQLRDPLIGTVTDPDGEPVAGVEVRISRAGGDGMAMLDLPYSHTATNIASPRTDARGRFAAQLPVGLPCRIEIDREPFAVYRREGCLPGLDVPIRLQRPGIVEGTVTGPDGAPATATVRGFVRGGNGGTLFEGATDEQGRFRFARVAPADAYIEVCPSKHPRPGWHRATITTGETLRYDVQLEEGRTLMGRVLDAVTGEAIAGAVVAEGWTLKHGTVTGADGRYELHGFGSAGYDSVHCRAEGYVRLVRKQSELDGAKPVADFRLERGHAVTGRIVDENGAPLADVYVQAFGSVHDGTDQYHSCVSTRTGDDGRFSVRGLREDLLSVLVLRQDGRATKVFALPEAEQGVRAVGDVTLPLPRIVRGVLRTPDRRPRPDTAVSIWGYNADRHARAPDGALARDPDPGPARVRRGWDILRMYVGRREVRTDHLGRFAFGDLAPGTWHVVAYDAENGKIAIGEPFELAADGPVPDITIDADR